MVLIRSDDADETSCVEGSMCPKRAAQMTVNQSMDRGARRRASSKSAGRVGSRCHEESSCSRYSCAAVSLRATRISPPQRGQCQSGATSVGVIGAGWGSGEWPSLASSVRARGNICSRKRLASRGCVDRIVLADQPHSFSNSQFSGLRLSRRNSQRRMASP